MKYISNKGFTLIELLVVISVISLLSSVILGSLNSARAKSRDSQRIQSLIQMRTALELYASDNGGKYPVNLVNNVPTFGWITSNSVACQGITPANGTTHKIADGLVSGKYISKIPVDPSNTASNCIYYIAAEDGSDYKLIVFGVESISNVQSPPHPLRNPNGGTKMLAVYSQSKSVYGEGEDPREW